MTEQEHSNMGVFAAQVLENPAFNEALRLMREDVIRQWRACPIRDQEGQMLFLQAAKITDKVEATLRGMFEAGKLANAKVNIDDARSNGEYRPESRIKRALRAIG